MSDTAANYIVFGKASNEAGVRVLVGAYKSLCEKKGDQPQLILLEGDWGCAAISSDIIEAAILPERLPEALQAVRAVAQFPITGLTGRDNVPKIVEAFGLSAADTANDIGHVRANGSVTLNPVVSTDGISPLSSTVALVRRNLALKDAAAPTQG